MNRPNRQQPKIIVKKKRRVEKSAPKHMGGYVVNGTHECNGLVLPDGVDIVSDATLLKMIKHASLQIDYQLNDPLVELSKMIEAEKVETRQIDRFTDFLK